MHRVVIYRKKRYLEAFVQTCDQRTGDAEMPAHILAQVEQLVSTNILRNITATNVCTVFSRVLFPGLKNEPSGSLFNVTCPRNRTGCGKSENFTGQRRTGSDRFL